MTATRPPLFKFQPLVDGAPLPGGKVNFYLAGTTTPTPVYASDGVTPLGTELVLDANGSTDFTLDPTLSYKINLLTSMGVQVPNWPVDKVGPDAFATIGEAIRSDLAATGTGKGAEAIGYIAPYAGASPTTVDARLDLVSDIRPATANGDNTFVGAAGNLTLGPSGGAATLASQNTGMGKDALKFLTTGFENTAIGVSAMKQTTTGNRNTAIGVTALASNTTGDHNLAIGQNALLSNTSGPYNTAVGIDAMHDNTTGTYNVAFGQNALLTCISGQYNTAIGIDSLKALTSGYNNTAIGNGALYRVTTGFYNTAVGLYALQNVTNHVSNVAVGQWAGYTNDGNANIFIGYQAGYYETGSNTLMIDNQSRTNEADARVKALIYGVFSTTVAGQRLVFNAGRVTFPGMLLRQAKAFTDLGGATTFTYPADTEYQFISSPGASLATTLPATNSTTIDGAEIVLVSAANIATTTWVAGAGGATFATGWTPYPSMTAWVPVRFKYHAAQGKWYPA